MRTRLFPVSLALGAAFSALLSSRAAEATITTNPASLQLAPGQGPVTVNVTVTFPPVVGCALFACSGSIVFNPSSAPGLIHSPANPSYSYASLQTSATTSFTRFSASA